MTPDLPYWPASMDQKSAAAYCGVCGQPVDNPR